VIFLMKIASIAEQACEAPRLQCKMLLTWLWKNPMRNVDEYRRSAASMLDLAQRADVADKNRLLVMAEAGLDLAARAAKAHRSRPSAGQSDARER
jgi:hypothetical protein